MHYAESYVCPNPACAGAWCTTEHVLWQCQAIQPDVRRLRMEIDEYVGKVKWRSPARAQAILELVESTCFRHTGSVSCKHNPFATANEFCNERDEAFDSDYTHHILEYPDTVRVVTDEEDGGDKVVVYTDGSASGTACRQSARAGYGVYYASSTLPHHSRALYNPPPALSSAPWCMYCAL